MPRLVGPFPCGGGGCAVAFGYFCRYPLLFPFREMRSLRADLADVARGGPGAVPGAVSHPPSGVALKSAPGTAGAGRLAGRIRCGAEGAIVG